MTRYQIVCVVFDENKSKLAKVGLTREGGDTTKYQYLKPVGEINNMVENGDTIFFTDEKGNEAEVSEYKDDYIRTDADEIVGNNLRHLNTCKI